MSIPCANGAGETIAQSLDHHLAEADVDAVEPRADDADVLDLARGGALLDVDPVLAAERR